MPLFLPCLAASCGGDLSALDPAGPDARAIALLWWGMLGGAAAIFLAVVLLLFLSFVRPGIGRSVPPRAWLLYGGIVAPSVLLTVLLAVAFAQGERLLARVLTPEAMRIEVRASMWAWDFSYPDVPGAGMTRDVLHMPVDRPVELAVTGTDVIHSFWIPRIGGKIDAIPGHVNVFRVRVDRPGTYHGVCAEFCGPGHAGMRFTVQAHDPGTFGAAAINDGGAP